MAIEKAQLTVTAPQANTLAERPVTPDTEAKPQAPHPQRMVDVADFRHLPISGAPKVSAKVDPTLGKTGLDAFLLDKLEGFGKIGNFAASGVRLFTRVVGPIGYWISAVRNARLVAKSVNDPTINGKSKVVLALGTVGTTLAAAASTVAALPLKLLKMVGLGQSQQLKANKLGGTFGGIASIGYATINMIETARNPDAKPAERLFSKIAFGMGALGFTIGTAAVFLPVGPLASLASKVCTTTGVVGLAIWGAQIFLGKNKWLNKKLKGSKVA